MRVHGCFVMAAGLVILSESVAFGDGKITAQVVQPAEYWSDDKLADLIGTPGQCQESRKARTGRQKARTGRQKNDGQDKSRIGGGAPASAATASETGAVSRPDLNASDLESSVCLMIEAAGRAHDLPPEFFARVIWQESRFRPDTVGPRTRNGKSAQGIAQFMPSTAAARGLLDPFDPLQALPNAAQFLRELHEQFGNLGLAAAAYNAGPARVRAWLAGSRKLAPETHNYVVAVTGVTADEWARTGTREAAVKTSPNCAELMAQLHRPASPQGPSPSHDHPVQSNNTQLAKNDLVTTPPASGGGNVGTPHQETPFSPGDMVEQPASPQRPSPSHDNPGQPSNPQLAKHDLVTTPPVSVGGDVATPQQETLLSRGDTSLFVEKLTERVKLVADSPWGVQLSAGFSRERVLAAYASIASRYAEILSGRDVSILSSVFRSRGTEAFYQIRVGTDTLESADNLCAEIRRAGGACMVLRNRS